MSSSAKDIRHPGQGVDAAGNPVVDPTENVKALSEAANKRQDDLRQLSTMLFDEKAAHLATKVGFANQIGALRAEHAKEIGALESSRLNAIRQVDVQQQQQQAASASAAVATLAATTATNAENLRNALATTATTIANQTAGTVSAMTERIAALEKSSYEGAGKQAVSDPAMAEIASNMKLLMQAQAASGGRDSEATSTKGESDSGKANLIQWVIAISAIGALLVSALAVTYVIMHGTK